MKHRICSPKWLRRLYHGLIGLILVISLWLGFLVYQIMAYSQLRSPESADVAIVLGAAVWDNEPSPVFAARIDYAVELYRRVIVRHIIFTGGKTPQNPLADSEVARAYAIRQGVAEGDISIETRSTITYTNLIEARDLLGTNAGQINTLIVSDPLHMRRSITMARDLGMQAIPAPTPYTRYQSWKSKVPFIARETFFYAGYLLLRPFTPSP